VILCAAGTAEPLESVRHVWGPLAVDDLDVVKKALARHGGEIVRLEDVSTSGRYR
jgi:hypothetical protein